MKHDEAVATIFDDVQAIARAVGREWSDVIDADDVEQETWLRLLRSSDEYVVEVAELERPARLSLLATIGQQIAQKARDDYEVFSGNYCYGTDSVRDMLENGALGTFTGDHGTDVPIWTLPESVIGQLNRTDTETATERIDLFIGLRRLSSSNTWYLQVLVANFVLSNPVHEHRKDLTRAVDALTKEMNRSYVRRAASFTTGPGSRSAMSNEQATRVTRRQ